MVEIVCAIAKVAFFDWSMSLSTGRVPFVNETVATQLARLKVGVAKELVTPLMITSLYRTTQYGDLAAPSCALMQHTCYTSR
jgi:hypothetical protein